ncbi:UNVERIFIED_CONTAM: Transcription factor GTE1 [Sesamum radiatum]|uniref:Transcription factor GTE1 n=1 Tax=Sesamum radiatum TaxID=300843 RepID=A0AAW2NB06_SESRA
MDLVNASNDALTNLGETMVEGNAAQEDDYKNKVDELFAKVDELYDIDMHIEELREMVVKKCRHMSTMEKRKLGIALSNLCPEDLSKALDIVAQNNLNFPATAEEVELDINAQQSHFSVSQQSSPQPSMAEKPNSDSNNSTSAAVPTTSSYLETSKAERHVWLMKCPPVVSRAMQNHQRHPPLPFSSDAGSGKKLLRSSFP